MSDFNAIAINPRNYFPRGLKQPQDFRFAVDALLLGSFAAKYRPEWRRMLDLGCGCGAASFTALLSQNSNSPKKAKGIDVQPEMLAAANTNAKSLGFDHAFEALHLNLETVLQPDSSRCCNSTLLQVFLPDLIIANPPYRVPGSGRMPKSPLRRQAMFGDYANLHAFVHSASLWLKPGGAFCLIMPYARAAETHSLLAEHSLRPAYGLKVFTKPNVTRFILLAATKEERLTAGFQPALKHWREDTLILHSMDGQITEEAKAFCPFLNTGA